MIATELAAEVRRLLQLGGLSQRGIALKLGISRGTVNAIALGRRPDYPAQGRTDEPGFTPPMGMPMRCPTCGGMVQMPCLLCYVRELKKRCCNPGHRPPLEKPIRRGGGRRCPNRQI